MPEQHFLKDTIQYRALLESIDLRPYEVLEVGVGTGVLTQLILDQNPKRVIGYEIEPGLCPIVDSRLDLRYEDVLGADLTFLRSQRSHLQCVISNPPYSLLPFLRQLIDDLGIMQAILMTSSKKLHLFPDFQKSFSLPPQAFEPETKSGEHLVIQKGF